jgi:hypothetical protein
MMVKSKFQISKQNIYAFLFVIYALLFVINPCYASAVTIAYTGDSHAMLYQCACPIERDGGVARRATLIKQLKKISPELLLLDAGRFFAGGLTDEYSQNTELDRQRTEVNLKAIESMGYDAVAISDDEFNFGKEFLFSMAEKTKVPFLSCNIVPASGIKEGLFKAYIIKEISGIKIGVIGVTSPAAAGKSGGLEFADPKLSVAGAVEELKKQAVGTIILLSNLEEKESLQLIREVAGIDILILGRSHTRGDYFDRVGTTLIMKPGWQGRRIGVAALTLEGNKIVNYEVNERRLSQDIPDDPEIAAVLPKCFADTDCKKSGLTGICKDPGAIKSNCLFSKPREISLLIVTPKSCRACDTEKVIVFLKKRFPGLAVSYLYYPDTKADKFIRDLGIKELPAYFLSKEAETEKEFTGLKDGLEKKGDFYLLKPQIAGVSYFLGREAVKGRLDLFISLYDKNAASVLDSAREFDPAIHFLAVGQGKDFDAKSGKSEIEEYLRSVCVQKYCPGAFWNYISCRARNIASSWWEDCLKGFDAQAIMSCAKGEEGKALLSENIKLNKELQVMFGPTYLLDNQEIFTSSGEPRKEELREIIYKRR